MPEEKLGIDALKNVVGAGLHLTMRLFEITAADSAGGKKITIPEILGSLSDLYQIIPAINSASVALLQIADLDETEEVELYTWVENEFDVPNDKVEKLVEQSIKVLIEIGVTVDLIIDLKNPV